MKTVRNQRTYPLVNMSNVLNRSSVRWSLIVGVVLVGLAAIEIRGYYKGLNVLFPIFLMFFVGSLALRNAFLFWLSLGTLAAYIILSVVTIAK